MSKPRVGVSACLLGQPVRYDGASRPHAWIREVLPHYAQILPFCPESEAGLETPRPAVRLVQLEGENVRILGVDNPELDVTTVLQQWVEQQPQYLQTLDALIFKSRSPSCGLATTPVFDEKGALLKPDSDGIFAAWVKSRYPNLVLFDDVRLEDRHGQALFLARLQKG
ncbi:MAG TPA: DUF523 domain-containing protein [Chromatiaceae bacterium]|nr:DUF523 domain-containing protein [Chromatiaceae bacterium]